jgi:cell wall-associated NlpC family hydrolase
VASHRRPKQASRTRVTVFTATAAAAVALSSQMAQAAPAKQSVKSVKAKVDALYEQAEQATEAYDGAQSQQQTLQKQVDSLQDEVAREQAELNQLQDELGTLASAQYRGGGIDPTVQLMLSSNPDDYLDKASAMDQLSAQQEQALKEIAAKKRSLDQQKAEAADKLAELDQTRTALAANKKKIQSKLAAARKLLNSLTAAQQAALDAQQARANRADVRIDLGSGVPASARAAAALRAAKSRLGSPYVYGASGPSSFDCSGLTSWAYSQAGVSIPRTSQAQAEAGTHLGESHLVPGDLVIFYGDYHHVGFYAGNGMVLHAPKPGAVVRYEAMSDMPFEFGVRI